MCTVTGTREEKERKYRNIGGGGKLPGGPACCGKAMKSHRAVLAVFGWKPESPGENHPHCCEVGELEG